MDPGIVLQWLSGCDDRARNVLVNGGVEVEATDQPGGKRFIPRNDWRNAAAPERELLFASRSTPLPAAVSVFKVDRWVRETFWSERAETICSPGSEIDPEARTAALWSCADDLVGAVAEHGIAAGSLRSCDIQITPAGSRSTAFDHGRGSYIGLHIDNHDKLPLARRAGAFQLLCLNLGQAERRFQFVNLPALELVAQVGLPPADAEERYGQAWRLTADFFEKRPRYPVVRVTLPPDHGYIVVTQHLIHDGATNSADAPDVALLLV